MAKPKTDPGYCRGCGRLNPCTRAHKGEELARLKAIQEMERWTSR